MQTISRVPRLVFVSGVCFLPTRFTHSHALLVHATRTHHHRYEAEVADVEGENSYVIRYQNGTLCRGVPRKDIRARRAR